MAETLGKVISGKISFPELVEWLQPTSSHQANELHFTELRADFAINFLNHLRDCNAWLVASIYVPSSRPSPRNASPYSPEIEENVKPVAVIKRNAASPKEVTPKSSKKKERVLLTLGCESYVNIRNKKHNDNGKRKQSQNNKSKLVILQSDGNFVKADNFEDFPVINSSSPCKTLLSSEVRNITFSEVLSQSAFEKFNNRLPCSDASNLQTKCWGNSPKLIQSQSRNSDSKKRIDLTFQNRHSVKNEVLATENFPKIGDNSLLQRRIEPMSSQLKSMGIQPFPQPSFDEQKDDIPCYVIPEPKLLQNKEKLFLFENIYNALFSYGLVTNVASELHFLFQLLTSAVDNKNFINQDHVLSTIHNCVHFAMSALVQQQKLLALLDNATLLLLCDIPYFKTFSPELVQFIVAHTNEKMIVRTKRKTYIDGVPYCEDTDTRSNFPNDESFNSFSKQRNLFYDILSMWETARKQTLFDASFERRFVEKVRLLMDLATENYNYFHLAKLFHKQLIVSCLHYAETSDGYGEKPSSYKTNVFQSLKLFKKLSSFIQTDDNCFSSAFHGPQTFFEAFLICASSVPLNDYLLNLFSSQIMELNKPDNFSEIKERSVEEIHEKFSMTLHTLRLLAKFYGFISFISYRSLKPLPKRLLNGQKELRKHSRSPLDLEKILTVAIKKQCLVITVPWVVEYLSLMDQVAPTLEQYLDICKILAKIYRGHFKQNASPLNYEFVRLVIGTLIEMPNFPLECVFYNYEYLGKDDIEVLEDRLDFQNVIDKQLVYSCCPYLAELKELIDNFLTGVKEKNQEITKISSKLSTLWQESDKLTEEQNMEMQMEENFFFSHPVILKQTVDFVAERITSRVIGQITNKIDELKTKAVDKISAICREQSKKDLDLIFNLTAIESETICKKSQKWASSSLKKATADCNANLPLREVKQVLPQLLNEEVDPEVADMSCRIASRMVMKKITDWIDSNIIPEKVMTNIKNRVQKVHSEDDNVPFVFDEEEIPPLESMNARLPFDYIRFLQNTRLKLDSKPDSFSQSKFIAFCEEITAAMKSNYLPLYVIEAVVWIVIDIVMTFIVYLPTLCTLQFLQNCVQFFSTCPAKLVLPSSFLNCQVLYLQTLNTSPLSWEKLTLFFECAIKVNLFLPEDFDHCVFSLSTFQWAASHLGDFKKFLEELSCIDENFTDFSALIQSVSEFEKQSL